jgi:4'-phosphopantetheinyl transferase
LPTRFVAPRTADGEVQAWIVDLDVPAGDRDQLLDAAERDRAASYLRAADGARFAASRAALRRILGRYLGIDPAAVRFDTGTGGRPVLANGPYGHDLQFSLSRSAGVAVVAVSAGPGPRPASALLVGADVEAIVPRAGLADLADLTDLAAARFSPAEAACIASAGCAGSPLRSFYRHWTAREAWLKAMGAGLAALREIEFDCCPVPAVRFRGTAVTAPDLRLHVLDISPDLAAAVAATGPLTSVRRLPPCPAPQ